MGSFDRQSASAGAVADETEVVAKLRAKLAAAQDELRAHQEEAEAQQDEIHYLRQRYDLMIEASEIGLWDMTVEAGDPVNPNNVFWWSQHFRHMLGFRDESDFPNVLDSWASRLHPDDKGWVLEAFGAHLNDYSGRTPYDVNYRLKMKTGEYRWFRASGATARDEDGVPVRVAGALHDIHKQTLLLEGAQATANSLRESSSALLTVSSDMSQASRRASEVVSGATERMTKLDESSTKIGEVISFITRIAQQTNLLALNATIEAARAGGAGKGFAVVADEVKELASETSKATNDISEQIETIRADSRSAVVAMGDIQQIMRDLDEHQTSIGSVVEQQRAILSNSQG